MTAICAQQPYVAPLLQDGGPIAPETIKSDEASSTSPLNPAFRSGNELLQLGRALAVSHRRRKRRNKNRQHHPDATKALGPNIIGARAKSLAPRIGSKLATVINLLQRSDGATISNLIEATGWLAHTTRAALTGLRKRDMPSSANGSMGIRCTESRAPLMVAEIAP